ncbi:oxidoreductase, short chain dehydrogenase/reductase family protein [Aeromicrobium marinum DSM 15272]|uniref:Oxidoreductase, short chain dehydrogenase/reductase family protein n=1 Tax=Aeromicrobium marinum DSM 15272 TaxID=585531 RepID=E2SA56_9ACTN|nr:3-oxoacyl-ACP reductase [Aeromicrobium marinum]EFQ84130.1 oxidoreductase, short chain dehydrogenase/reductase family protein [Aeromicrobium marinum DSM 15272]
MSDRYQDLAHNPIGKFLVKNLGLPNPPYLERYTGGPLVRGTVLTGSATNGAVAKAVTAALKSAKIEATGVAAGSKTYKGLVFDASGIDSAAGLVALQEFFTPVLRQVAPNARVVVIGALPSEAASEGAAIAQRALEGFTRSLGKEIGGGSTVNLVLVAKGAEKALGSTLGFLLSPKSAYVSGQVVRVGTTGITSAPTVKELEKPLAGKVALVTGASRGLGEADMRVLARDGATVIGLDVPPLEADLKALATELGGGYIVGDITADDAPETIAAYVKEHHGGIDIIVHNAGITRDKRLRNMKSENWQLVVDISVGAPQRITDHLLDQGLLNDGGRVVGIASIAGIAGNNGQTNYASAKAGVIGWIESLSARVADRGITANVIAPGFMETEMVKTIPLGVREAGRRMNSMSQGGLPVDVAETIAWLASPGTGAVSGNVIGVNGQMLLGAS